MGGVGVARGVGQAAIDAVLPKQRVGWAERQVIVHQHPQAVPPLRQCQLEGGQRHGIGIAHAAGIDDLAPGQEGDKAPGEAKVVGIARRHAAGAVQFDAQPRRPAHPQDCRRAAGGKVAFDAAGKVHLGPAAQAVGQIDRHRPPRRRPRPCEGKREAAVDQRIAAQEGLHLGVVSGITLRDERVVPRDQVAFFRAAEGRAAPVFDEKPAKAQMPPAQRADLLAPVDFFAIAASEGGVEGGQAAQPGDVDRHAEAHAGGYVGQVRPAAEPGCDTVDGVGLPRGQIVACADRGRGQDFGVVRHGRHGRHMQMVEHRADQPRRPALRHQRVGVEQDHMPPRRHRLREGKVDRGDEAQIAVVFDQRDPVPPRRVKPGMPVAQPGPHGGIGRGIFDQNQVPGQIGVAQDTVQHLGQKVEGVVDRQHDRHPCPGQPRRHGRRRGHVFDEQMRVQPFRPLRGRETERGLDPRDRARVAAQRPAQDVGQRTTQARGEIRGEAAAHPAQRRPVGLRQREDIAHPVTFGPERGAPRIGGQIKREARRLDRADALGPQHVVARKIGGLGSARGAADQPHLRSQRPAGDAVSPARDRDAVEMAEHLALRVGQGQGRQREVAVAGDEAVEKARQAV